MTDYVAEGYAENCRQKYNSAYKLHHIARFRYHLVNDVYISGTLRLIYYRSSHDNTNTKFPTCDLRTLLIMSGSWCIPILTNSYILKNLNVFSGNDNTYTTITIFVTFGHKNM